jgi:hypothetical protein
LHTITMTPARRNDAPQPQEERRAERNRKTVQKFYELPPDKKDTQPLATSQASQDLNKLENCNNKLVTPVTTTVDCAAENGGIGCRATACV